MTATYYPVALDLIAKPCLVVGGGSLATEKVEGLLRAGAHVTVVSRVVTAQLARLAEEQRITVILRAYDPGDLRGQYLAYGASEDRALNARVAGHARELGVIVNAVDDIPNCDFYAMAIARRGDLQVAVSTDGKSPALARWVREYLDGSLPVELGDLLEVLSEVRREVKSRGETPDYLLWSEAIRQAIPAVRAGDGESAHRTVRKVVTGDRQAPRAEVA